MRMSPLLLISILSAISIALSLRTVSAVRSKPAIVEHNILHKLSQENSVLIIDGDNLRGKTKFSLSKEDVCRRLERWVVTKNLSGRVVLVYDHASQQCSFMLKSGVAVVFAGPQLCADDIIARDVDYIRNQFNSTVTVVTDDKQLRRRCNGKSKRILKKEHLKEPNNQLDVHIITSTAFAEFIMTLTDETTASFESTELQSMKNMTAAVEVLTSPNIRSIMSNFNSEIDLRRKLSQVRTLLVNTNRKQRSRLQSREKQIQYRLERIQISRSADSIETLKQLSAIVDLSPPITADSNDIFELRFDILSKVLDLFKYDRSHIEDTWERVILAEKFRESLSKSTIDTDTLDRGLSFFLQPYVDNLNEVYGESIVSPSLIF